MKKLVAFDLDGTLAESKQPLADNMAALLGRLLVVAQVAVISGGDWPQFETRVAGRMPHDATLDRLWLMPNSGSKPYRFQDGDWTAMDAHLFTSEQGQRIRTALDKAVTEAGLDHQRTWGEQIEERGSQITVSGDGRLEGQTVYHSSNETTFVAAPRPFQQPAKLVFVSTNPRSKH